MRSRGRFRSLPQPVAAGCGGAGRGAGARTPARHHLLPKHRPVAAGGPAEQSAPGAAAARRRRPSRDHARAGIDAMLVEEDTLGDAACFSERVVTLPRDCVVHAAARLPGPARVARRGEPASRPGTPLRVAVCATSLKLNARFRRCAGASASALPGRAISFLRWRLPGVAHAALRRTVTAAVPQAHVHESMPYEDYLAPARLRSVPRSLSLRQHQRHRRHRQPGPARGLHDGPRSA